MRRDPQPGDAGARSYWAAVRQADRNVDAEIEAVRVKENAGELTVVESAEARIRILEAHLGELARLRREYLGAAD